MKRKAENQIENEDTKKASTEESTEESTAENTTNNEQSEKEEKPVAFSAFSNMPSVFESPSPFNFFQLGNSQGIFGKENSTEGNNPDFKTTSTESSTEGSSNNFNSFSFSSSNLFSSNLSSNLFSSGNSSEISSFPTYTPTSVESSESTQTPTLQTAVSVITGEEDEDNLLTLKAKAFRFVNPKWRERGQGNLRVNKSKESNKTRIVMRNDKTLQLILNVPLVKGCRLKKFSDKDIQIFSVDLSEGLEYPNHSPILIRVKSVAECNELYHTLHINIPDNVDEASSESDSSAKQEPNSEPEQNNKTDTQNNEETSETNF